jgi:hypothetical protein
MLRSNRPSSRLAAGALLAATLSLSSGARAGDTVVAATWSRGGQARLLAWEDGVGWSTLPAPSGGFGREIWDLEVIDGELWVACGSPGRLLRGDGASWFDETPTRVSTSDFVAVLPFDGTVFAVDAEGLHRRIGPADWYAVATLPWAGQAIVSEAHPGHELLFLGQDREDEFWFHEPDRRIPCRSGCPSASGNACPAGCFGGSCVYSFADHDDGTGPTLYAGAYEGAMYAWHPATLRFRAFTGPTAHHVQGLAAFQGELWVGDAEGRLFASPVPSSLPFVLRHDLGSDRPVSELAVLDGALWVGTGGVPFSSARRGGEAGVRTFDGTSWTDRTVPGLFDDGVLAFALLPGVPTTRCDAGPEQTLECLDPPIPVTLDGSASQTRGATPDLLTWTGPFIEGTATGPTPTVHFDGPGEHVVTLEILGAGVQASCTTTVRVQDTRPPVLAGLPDDLSASCADPLPPAPPVSAEDACDPAPSVSLAERTLPGPCPDAWELERTWTARDASGHEASASRRVSVRDDSAPSLLDVPADATVDCDAVPTAATVRAVDDCDPAPAVSFDEQRLDGSCPDSYTLHRSWTARDRCGNSASADQVVVVTDSQGPVLLGVPADGSVECDAVPAPAAVTAVDGCDPAPREDFAELRIDGPCPDTYTLHRTWTASDRCGNVVAATQVIEVVDTQPPVVTASDELVACLWPPNHAFACIDRELLSPTLADACSEEVAWELADCLSSQPDDELGDGSTDEDCVVAADGQSACLRAERQGLDPAGRTYSLAARATDACGNVSAPVVVGTVRVPHDAAGLDECPRVLRSRP